MWKWVAFVFVLCVAITVAQQKEDPKYKITPTKTKKYGAEVYVPANLEDAFKELDKMLTKAFREEFRKGKENEVWKYHHGFGTWIRNEWGLWKGLRLAKWFNKQGIKHPDDMSGIIFKSYWRRLNKKPLDLPGQIKHYQDYWKQSQVQQETEQARVIKAKASIKKMMMGLEFHPNPAEVEFRGSMQSDIFVVHAGQIRSSIFVTVEKYDPQTKKYGRELYMAQPSNNTLEPLSTPGIHKAEDFAIVGNLTYIQAQAKGKTILVESAGEQGLLYPYPEGGPFQLGVELNDAGLPVRPIITSSYAAYRWIKQSLKWEAIPTGGVKLPISTLQPTLAGGRLYFRDEGRSGSNKRLWWLDLKNPKKLVSFDGHIGVVGPDGPRWETVWSFASAGGKLWLVTGSHYTSLLSWKPQGGYGIAVYNKGLKYLPDFFDSADSPDDRVMHSLAVAGIEAQPDGSILVAGARGIFKVTDKTITPVVWFDGTPAYWKPNTVVTLGPDKYFLGSEQGGAFLVQKKEGQWEVVKMDRRSPDRQSRT